MSALKRGVIYPYGPLLDLHQEDEGCRAETFYAIEFTGMVVKVGVSRNVQNRASTLGLIARNVASLTPTRFMVWEAAANIRRVERAAVEALRDAAEPFAALAETSGASEWFANAQLETVQGVLAQWEVVEVGSYGRRLAIPTAELVAKTEAEQVSA